MTNVLDVGDEFHNIISFGFGLADETNSMRGHNHIVEGGINGSVGSWYGLAELEDIFQGRSVWVWLHDGRIPAAWGFLVISASQQITAVTGIGWRPSVKVSSFGLVDSLLAKIPFDSVKESKCIIEDP